MKNKLILSFLILSPVLFGQDTLITTNQTKVVRIVDRFYQITGPNSNCNDSIALLTAQLAELSLINEKLIQDKKSMAENLQEIKKSLYKSERNFIVEKYGTDNLKSEYSLEQYTDFKQNYFLQAFFSNKNETLVFFPFDKSTTNLKMYQEIDSLVAIYFTGKKMKFKITAYSDSKGLEERNSTLSRERAEFIKNYLVNEKKVNSKDIQTEGKGSKSNEQIKETELDFMNRRSTITLN